MMIGYGTVWEGGSPPADLARVEAILDATSTLVVLEADPARARALGRPSVVKPYLGLRNYTTNLQRLGFTAQDVAGEGSDALIDALVVSGDDAEISRRFEEHHHAGADHVAVQLIAAPGADIDAGFRRLAGLLPLPLN
jgi:probable F420-dependent oxidoreductase